MRQPMSFSQLTNRLSQADLAERADHVSCPLCRGWWLASLDALWSPQDTALTVGEKQLPRLDAAFPSKNSTGNPPAPDASERAGLPVESRSMSARFAQAHLDLVRALRSVHRKDAATALQWPNNQVLPLEDAVLRQVAADLKLPPGLIRDLHAELTHSPLVLAEERHAHAQDIILKPGARAGTARVVLTKERVDGGWWGLKLRPPERQVSVKFLLLLGEHLPTEEPGLVAQLTLEKLPDGEGHLYPVPALGFTRLVGGFDSAITNAAQAAVKLLGWPASGDAERPLAHAGCDVRWFVTLKTAGLKTVDKLLRAEVLWDRHATEEARRKLEADNHVAAARARGWCGHPLDAHYGQSPWPNHELPVPRALSGPSAGLSFAVGLVALLADEQHRPDLLTLDVGQTALSGAIEPDGSVGAVAGINLSGKLGADFRAQVSLRAVRELVYPASQTEVPETWFKPGEAPVAAKAVTHLAQALEFLREQTGPRQILRAAEQAASGTITFVNSATLPMDVGYCSTPPLQEVLVSSLPKRPKRERRDGQPEAFEPRDEAEELQEAARRRERDETEERLVKHDRTFKPVNASWSELLEDFSVHCGEAVRMAKAKDTTAAHEPFPGFFVVIGPPGAGKSTLVKHLAFAAATAGDAFACIPVLPVTVSLRQWHAWQEQHPGQGLMAYLAATHPACATSRSQRPTEADFRRWREAGDCLFLLDGLDEVSGEKTFIEQVAAELGELRRRNRVVLTCRQLNYEDYRDRLGDWPIFKLGELTWEQQQAFITRYPSGATSLSPPPRRGEGARRAGEGWSAGRLMDGVPEPWRESLPQQLRAQPQMQPLAGIPALLDIICYAAADGLELPATRSELYDVAVTRLLERRRGPEPKWPAEEPEVGEQRQLLALACFRLFHAGGLEPFTRRSLREHLRDECAQAGYATTRAELANALTALYTDHAGLVRFTGELGVFLHNSFFEFLAAEGMAEHINQQGWLKPIIGEQTARQLLFEKAQQSSWSNVLAFLPSRLNDPPSFFRLLAPVECGVKPDQPNPEGPPEELVDDLTRHRLTLAVCGVGQVTAVQLRTHERFFTDFAGKAFGCWFGHRTRFTDPLVKLLEENMSGLARTDFQFRNGPWHQTLPRAHQIEFEASRVVESAARALSRMFAVGTNQTTVVETLLRSLREGDRTIRHLGADALGEIGSRAANHAGVVEALVRVLEDKDPIGRYSAAEALGKMGVAVAGYAGVLDGLVRLLRDTPLEHGYKAAKALGAMGVAAVGDARVVEALVRLLHEDAEEVRFNAAEALGAIGVPAAAHAGVIEALVRLLGDGKWLVRSRAAKALGNMGEVAASNSGVFEVLVLALQDQEPSVGAEAAVALGKITSAAPSRDRVVELLCQLLPKMSRRVCYSPALALGNMGAAAASRAGVVAAFVRLLQDENSGARYSAAEALGMIGAAAAKRTGVVKALVQLLCDEEPAVRKSAAVALGKMGAAAAEHPGVVEALAGLLSREWDSRSGVGRGAVDALGQMGASAASQPGAVKVLVESLGISGTTLSYRAAVALGKMGADAARRAGVIEKLVGLLEDEYRGASHSAAIALTTLGRGFTVFVWLDASLVPRLVTFADGSRRELAL